MNQPSRPSGSGKPNDSIEKEAFAARIGLYHCSATTRLVQSLSGRPSPRTIPGLKMPQKSGQDKWGHCLTKGKGRKPKQCSDLTCPSPSFVQTTLLDGNVRITAARELLLERGSIDGRTEFQIYFAALVYDHGE